MAEEGLVLDADVLVVGGGPAAAWAAWAALSKGSRTVLVDKGYMGASGACAASGNSLLNPPPRDREAILKARYASGQYLGDLRWMDRIFETTWRSLPLVEDWGYQFPQVDGASARESFWGPEYLRVLRKMLLKAGVQILDHSPALELLVDADGAVAGARGLQRQQGGRDWTVRAKAVVLAAGGAAFLSKVLGCNTNTGDGLLMAAEVGAEFLGMEFSSQYAISSALNATVTRGVPFAWATYTDEAGQPLAPGPGGRVGTPQLARALLRGPVYAQLDKATPEVRKVIESSHFITFYPLEKAGVDPYGERFPVTLVAEGTVRGTGGIRLAGEDCSTAIPGLYVAGDSAQRVLLGGANTAGGGPSAAWCIASGQWAGAGAAEHAKDLGDSSPTRALQPAGRAGLRPEPGQERTYDPDAVVRAVQAEVLPYDKGLFRNAWGLKASLKTLEGLWQVQKGSASGQDARSRLRAREAAALTATARWMYSSALERRESRGMHLRTDYPDIDPSQRGHLISGGLDHPWVRREALPPMDEPVGLAGAQVPGAGRQR
jgi:succinate dehydrogenase/fumarate reductase flavoprotein subunit